MSGTIRLPTGMLNQRTCHLLINQRDNILVQLHRDFNIRAGCGFGDNYTTHLIVAIINDV